MTNLDSILKSRDITLPTKVCLVKVIVFPVVMHGCENWTIKKAECWRTDAFELWCWKRLLRVPWTARKSNQSILKPISPEYSLEGLMLEAPVLWNDAWSSSTLEPDVKSQLIGRDPNAGKDWRQENKGTTITRMWLLDGIPDSMDEFEQTLGDGEGQESLMCCSTWGHKESDKTEWLNNNSNT